MDNNRKIIIDFVNKYCDSLVIDGDKVVILRGWRDCEEDYYWILQDLYGNYYDSSCVGEIIALRNKIDSESYNRLAQFFQYNLNLINKEIK